VTDLWYDETGEGPPLVLLHEGVVDSRIWEPVVPLLAERHRVIRYDQRGFGRSPRPDGPYSLILLGSGLPGVQLDVGWAPEQIARWERADADDDWSAMAELDMEVWAPMGADPELRAMFLENAVWSNSEDPATDEPVAERVSGITAPTLVITAGRDVRGINEIGDRLARDIPDARSAVIEEADHMIPWRAPEELSHLILDFLSGR
jgi:3-oxoadipate enol-lactonase